MQIAGISSSSMISNLDSVQTKAKGDFAEHLAQETEKAQQVKDNAKLKKTCQDLEAVFLNIMMTNMRKTVDKSKLVDSSKEETMTSMLDAEMTKDMAKAGGIGLADMLYRQLRTPDPVSNKSQAPK
ncbi:rod-binding protein [Pelosinus fermentans]|uniref:Flagellar protein FlgJ n=1 Tax=Pelosinus fermentans JBW45 TaxID=1192197 RepID=I9DDH4_9FIRM|nr:rod-binding protein [Pelosinus fermentans]AJQ25938.1 Flagellar protein FlgJ [Pelosinus fermentans JBW45]